MRKRRAVGKKAAITRKRRTSMRSTARVTSTPAVIPMISYEDGIAALEWLRSAFGFRETARLTTPDGKLSHGEMEAGNGLIMLASPTPEYRSPKRHREGCEQARKWSAVPWIIDGVLVYVNNLDRHFERAKTAGATILSAVEEGPPGRRYRAEDLEGHRWFFFETDHV
jgi:PhnB protein